MPIPPPTPSHILRSHTCSISALYISEDNERIYSGDSSGLVNITSARTLRTISSWKAHSDGILGVQESEDLIVTHGRDNKLHFWRRPQDGAVTDIGSSAATPGMPTPSLVSSMDVNALNYCRFSLMPLEAREDSSDEILIALPNLIDSAVADVWSLPSQRRLHAAVGTRARDAHEFSIDGRGGPDATGILMSLHLFTFQSILHLLCAFENGSVTLQRLAQPEKRITIEGKGWETVWSTKLHVETVMAMTVSRDKTFALTVSADNLIGHYSLPASPTLVDVNCGVSHKTKHAGNSVIAIHDDGRVCAAGCWDGKIRLYSTRTFKSLGTLVYHKESIQALVFSHKNCTLPSSQPVDEDSEDEDTVTDRERRARWMIAGSKDGRVTIWTLMDFNKT